MKYRYGMNPYDNAEVCSSRGGQNGDQHNGGYVVLQNGSDEERVMRTDSGYSRKATSAKQACLSQYVYLSSAKSGA